MNHKYLSPISILFLVFTVLAAYWQIQNSGFVNYDDNTYVTENLHVQRGLTIENIIWAFSTTHMANWHPITLLTHMLDCQLYGLNAKGHHLTNLFLHIINAILLFLLLKDLTRKHWQSIFVAALFALHPLHVESVAWIAERKDVLSTLFWMLTMWAYVKYARLPGYVMYLLTILFFSLGLMSKPMLVTLPFVLLLLDYWPLGRIQSKENYLWHTILRLVREKIPLFVITVIFSIVTFLFQQSAGTVKSIELFTLKDRIVNALFSYVSYIVKMIYPLHLSVFYPHPGNTLPVWQYVGAGLLIVCASILVFWKARARPYLLIGWLWYLGTLVPVIGIVQVGSQAVADRYSYVPLIGIFIIIAWGVPELLSRWKYREIILSGSGGIVIITLMTLTWFQVGHWQNSITLFEHALDVTTQNAVAHNNLGTALDKEGKADKAISHYTKALHINPNYAEVHNNLGNVMERNGNLDKAVLYYKEALRVNPNRAEVYYNLGTVLMRQNKINEAILYFEEALQIKPDSKEIHNNLGIILARQGVFNKAIFHYKEALRINPDFVEVHNNLGNVLKKDGKLNEAIFHYKEALRIKPDYAEAHNNMGIILFRERKFEDAIFYFKKTIQINPDHVNAYNNLSWILATNKNPKFRDAAKAVKLAEIACKLTGHKQPRMLYTLAISYSEACQYEKATQIAHKAIEMAHSSGQDKLAKDIKKRMQLYKSGSPFTKIQ